jgi:D-glycero-alpha-D-manno-heptose-7-phosphate kinase
MIDLNSFKIKSNSTLRDALEKINENHHGIVFATSSNNNVIGVATDGDIRSALINGGSLNDSLEKYLNTDFVWADELTTREQLLKQLDHRIQVIPILNQDRELVNVISRYNIPVVSEANVYAKAKSPVRISFGGGGSDLTHYFFDSGGAVINAAISLYAHAALHIRQDGSIRVHSRDLNEILEAADLEEALKHNEKFGLIQAVLKTIHPDFGFDLYLHSDFPMKSGLGGSAVVAASILGCFNQFRRDKWDLYEISELAYQAERLYLGVAGGWQDQYATVFGGFNFMEFRAEQNVIHPLRISRDVMLELEESLILCDTGTVHESGDIHKDQKAELDKSDIRNLVKQNVDLTFSMRDQLLRGRLLDFGKTLDQAWKLKRLFSQKISNTHLDSIYESAKKNGAIGGKLLGAGGGGFFLFYVPSQYKNGLMNAMEALGNTVRPFRFEPEGLRSWTVRENKLEVL